MFFVLFKDATINNPAIPIRYSAPHNLWAPTPKTALAKKEIERYSLRLVRTPDYINQSLKKHVNRREITNSAPFCMWRP